MKNLKRCFLWTGLAAAAFAIAGCSTPDSRIAANPQAFNSLPPQQQALVRVGQVAIGMSMEAVKLALGDPDRVTIRTDAQGEGQIWHYVTYESDGLYLYTGYYHHWRRRGGWGWWGPDYPWYMDYPNRTVHDRFTVEFRNGAAVAVNREQE